MNYDNLHNLKSEEGFFDGIRGKLPKAKYASGEESREDSMDYSYGYRHGSKLLKYRIKNGIEDPLKRTQYFLDNIPPLPPENGVDGLNIGPEPCRTCSFIAVCGSLETTCGIFRSYCTYHPKKTPERGFTPDRLWENSFPGESLD